MKNVFDGFIELHYNNGDNQSVFIRKSSIIRITRGSFGGTSLRLIDGGQDINVKETIGQIRGQLGF